MVQWVLFLVKHSAPFYHYFTILCIVDSYSYLCFYCYLAALVPAPTVHIFQCKIESHIQQQTLLPDTMLLVIAKVLSSISGLLVVAVKSKLLTCIVMNYYCYLCSDGLLHVFTVFRLKQYLSFSGGPVVVLFLWGTEGNYGGDEGHMMLRALNSHHLK